MEITLEVDTWFGKQKFVIKIVALKYITIIALYCIRSFHILGSQKFKTSNMLSNQMKYLDLKEDTKASLAW